MPARNITAENRKFPTCENYFNTLKPSISNRRLPMPPMDMAASNSYANGYPAVHVTQAPSQPAASHHRLASYSSAGVDSRPGSRSNGSALSSSTPDTAGSRPYISFPQPDAGDPGWRPASSGSEQNGRLPSRPLGAQAARIPGYDGVYEEERPYSSPSSLDDMYYNGGDSRVPSRQADSSLQPYPRSSSISPSGVYANGDCKFSFYIL